MNVITQTQYLENPCRIASVPYWKAVHISVPEDIRILHEEEFRPELLKQYSDEPYFRLEHCLQDVKSVSVSGQCFNPANPEGLYRKCGFSGTDVWHILRKKSEV